MSLIKQLATRALKFTPATAEVNWERIETLVHGPGAGYDKRTINSAVFACLMAVATAYPEPPLVVMQKDPDGNDEHLEEHPLQDLLTYPTPDGELTMEELLFWTAWAKHVDGNAYWLKVRSGNALTGNVVEIWPISPSVMEPATEKGDNGRPADWISYYKYHITPSETVRVPVKNVVHFRLGLDDKDMRKGLAPLKALVREMSSDNEANQFIDALLKNYAVPGLVVIPAGGVTISEGDADRLTNKLRQKFSSESRGNIAVMSRETQVHQFGFSPKDLDMSTLHRVPEERIAAVIGVPAIVAGLGAGLERATYANFKEAREMFTEGKLIPQWRADDAKINASLKPDFTDDPDIYVKRDLNEVRALQEDQNSKYERLQKAVAQKAWLTRNEARTETGFDPVEEWEEADIAPPQIPPQLQQGQNQNQPGQNGNGRLREEEEMLNEMRTWHRWSLKQIEKYGRIERDFETSHLPLSLSGAIAGALEEARSADDVERVFANIWNGYP
ncbi:MAG: Phage portal protein, HK97 family [Candidatus Gottesmanbacteria bacterium GW2011_GWB1_49_7]|uniref:Phage portal protein, HK97 family n=1 Tax=Candidatus Gottesmanbacteria bacterium GW2011_GWB1_49_7 TaxID=1618448 RepID=A0A0G1YEI1_9BACT|nr:MAG: Phage portal protein, HK97 family [Candidatus Gottesmanbacteria bacterium GW2011_GWB1_49_7]